MRLQLNSFNYYEFISNLGMRRAGTSFQLMTIVLFLVVAVPVLSASAVIAPVDLTVANLDPDYDDWDLFGDLKLDKKTELNIQQ